MCDGPTQTYPTHTDRKREQPKIATNSGIYTTWTRHSRSQQAPDTQASFLRYGRCHRHTETAALSLPLSVMDYAERGMNWRIQWNNVRLAKGVRVVEMNRCCFKQEHILRCLHCCLCRWHQHMYLLQGSCSCWKYSPIVSSLFSPSSYLSLHISHTLST